MRGGGNIWRAAAPMQCHAAKNRNGCPARIDSDRESWRPSHPPIAATFVRCRRTAAGQTKICKLYRLYRYAIYLHQAFLAIRRNRSNVKRKEVSQTIFGNGDASRSPPRSTGCAGARVLETFSGVSKARSLSQIEEMDINRSAIQRLVHTFAALGYIERTCHGFVPARKLLDRTCEYMRGNLC